MFKRGIISVAIFWVVRKIVAFLEDGGFLYESESKAFGERLKRATRAALALDGGPSDGETYVMGRTKSKVRIRVKKKVHRKKKIEIRPKRGPASRRWKG